MSTLTGEQIHDMAIKCGFDNCGVIPLSDFVGYGDKLSERISKIPMSAMLYDRLKPFANLEKTYPWAKSAVVTIFYFGKYKYPTSLQGYYGKGLLLSPENVPQSPANQGKLKFQEWMAEQGIRYAGGQDYGASRNMPLRYAAEKAGLGIIRQNNFFYGPNGSWYELDGYIIDHEAVYKEESDLRPCSSKCGLCRKACPSGALCDANTMNPLLCVSFTTTYGNGNPVPPATLESIGEWICGCDACQDACPYNKRHDWAEGEDFPELDAITDLLSPEGILAASDEDLREKIIPKTADHLRDDQADLLRRMAKNSISNRKTENQI